MARYSILLTALAVAIVATSVTAFAPGAAVRRFAVAPGQVTSRSTPLNMGFMGDEPPKLTRETEPEDFFSSDVDKMSDKEKIPIALAGLAFVSLPFIAGLIFLYASK
mmetsp:Transcript_27635/g.50166  ORF Transcript_27635/g.50166 Transcript_27635/m.50166 type:complete len:107 (+) Transcript_27635:138-458(+)